MMAILLVQPCAEMHGAGFLVYVDLHVLDGGLLGANVFVLV